MTSDMLGSPTSDPKSVYSDPDLLLVLLSSSLVYVSFLRSHFSVSLPKRCVAEPEATGPTSEGARALRSLISFFCSSLPLNFSRLSQTFFHPLPLAQTEVAYSMLKHFPCSGMDLLHIFNLAWSLHSFPSKQKTSSIIPIHKMGNLLTLLLPFDLPLSLPASQSFLKASFISSTLHH